MHHLSFKKSYSHNAFTYKLLWRSNFNIFGQTYQSYITESNRILDTNPRHRAESNCTTGAACHLRQVRNTKLTTSRVIFYSLLGVGFALKHPPFNCIHSKSRCFVDVATIRE